MKQIVLAGSIFLVILSGFALAQQSGQGAETSGMDEMMGQMRGQEGGSGMGGMGGMMGMMKMMQQCTAMMASHGAAHGDGKGESALDILKKRYARGEIGKEEFERLKKDIQ